MKQKHFLQSLINLIGLAIAIAALVLDTWGADMSAAVHGHFLKAIAFAGGLVVMLRTFRANTPITQSGADALKKVMSGTALVIAFGLIWGCAATWPDQCKKKDTPDWVKQSLPGFPADSRMFDCNCEVVKIGVENHPEGLKKPAALLWFKCTDPGGKVSFLPFVIKTPDLKGVPVSKRDDLPPTYMVARRHAYWGTASPKEWHRLTRTACAPRDHAVQRR